MNKSEFRKLIKTLVKEEMVNQKELMEIGDMPFSMKGYGDIEGDKYGYDPEEDLELMEPKLSGKEKIKAAIDAIAAFFGKPKSAVTKDEVRQYMNKK